jgi:hypothetical protein
MCGANIEIVHQPGDVVGPNLHVVMLKWPFRLAVSAHVEIDAAESLRQDRRCSGEIKVSEARAVDLNHGLAVTGFLVPDAYPVYPRFRHEILPGALATICGRLRLTRRCGLSAAQCRNQVGEKFIAEAHVSHQKPVCLIAVAGNDRLDNRPMFLGSAA